LQRLLKINIMLLADITMVNELTAVPCNSEWQRVNEGNSFEPNEMTTEPC
jgi:hypothetical protein